MSLVIDTNSPTQPSNSSSEILEDPISFYNYMVMAYIGMAYTVMAYIVMVYMMVAYIVLAFSYAPHSYGLYGGATSHLTAIAT